MLDDPLGRSPTLSLEATDVERLLTAAFGHMGPAPHADPDRPVLQDLRLEVLEPLGHGGLGAVYLCRDRRMKREVALKILRARHAGNVPARDGLLWEARLGSRLDHPGIVPVHEIGVDDTGRPFFTMRVVRGETLRKALLAEPTGETRRARMLRVLLQIAEAVAHAHGAGIVHSDLKPENVMVGPNGEVLVIDWGLARSQDADDDRRQSSASSKAGTPAYMAPERSDSPPPPLAPAVDVFSLGVILLEILTGPQSGATTANANVAVGSGAALATRLDGDEPAELRSLAVDSVESRPDSRPRDAAAFAARLGSALEHLEEDARQARLEAAAAGARADAEQRARRTVQGLFAAVVITAGAAGALWLNAERATERRRAGQLATAQDALDESHTLTAGLDSTATLARLREASELLGQATRGLDGDLLPSAWTQRLETRRAELEQQALTAEADVARQDWREELLTALQACDLEAQAGMHAPSLGRCFGLALEAAGMDPSASTVVELDSPYPLDPVRDELIDTLDIWAMFGFNPASAGVDAESRRLRGLAQELDPNPDRRRVRQAVMTGDHEVLEQLMPTRGSAPLQSPTSYVMLGEFFADEGDIARAHAVWREGCFAFPDDPWCHVLLGYDWSGLGLDRAREHLWAAVALEPSNPSPWTNLAYTYQEQGRSEDALRAYRYVAEVLKPESAITLGNYWGVQFDLGLLEGALATCRKWQDLHRNDANSLSAIVLTLKAMGRTEEVLNEQRDIAQHWIDEGSQTGAALVYGEALWRTGALDEARQAYLPPNGAPPEEVAERRYKMGRVAMDDDQFEEALGHFTEVAGDSALAARALGMQGLALARMDRLIEARDCLERAEILRVTDPGWDLPTGQWLEVVMSDLRLDSVIAGEASAEDAAELGRAARRCVQHGDHARAFELFERAFDPDPMAAGVPLTEGAESALLALAALASEGVAADDERAIHFRETARGWLRNHYNELVRNYPTGVVGPHWIEQLRSWETSSVMAPIRESTSLAMIPERERQDWVTLWRKVREFLKYLENQH